MDEDVDDLVVFGIGTIDIDALHHYLHTQQALGNWPPGSVFDGDEVLLALIDTYGAVDGD